MTRTQSQNEAHRNDLAWIKSTGRHFTVNGEHYVSEYVNPWTGQAIRKDWRMTGLDWVTFDAAGNITGWHHSLTYAKLAAKK